LRFRFLRLVQASVIPQELRDVLRLKPSPLVGELLRCYRFLPGGGNKLRPLHNVLLPGRLAKQLREMESAPDADDNVDFMASFRLRRGGAGGRGLWQPRGWRRTPIATMALPFNVKVTPGKTNLGKRYFYELR